MGGTCSMQRQRALWREEEPTISGRRRTPSECGLGAKGRQARRSSLRHSVVSMLPDRTIAALYPVEDNYVGVEVGRRSPKRLSELCVEAVCRSLTNLNGALPTGLPLDIVDDLVDSLVERSALNATTLSVLKNCELGRLPLAGCRGVTDEWLVPFVARINNKNVHSTLRSRGRQVRGAEGLDADCSGVSVPSIHDRLGESSCHSTASFVSASCLDQDIEELDVTSFNAAKAPSIEDVVIVGESNMNEMKSLSSLPSSDNLTLLDLRGSQGLTDRGILQLSNLDALEIAKLDSCHSIVGGGLMAFASSRRLRALSMTNCRRLTDEAIINISHLVMLQALSLDGCRCITDRSLAAISGLYELVKLDLSQCDLITDNGLKNLEGLGCLQELSLGWCRSITDEGLKTISSHAGRSEVLRILRLARCMITGGSVESLGSLSSLLELDLNGCSQIGSVALGLALERMPNLQILDVSYCPAILKASWQGKIQSLKSLELCYADVMDIHLSKLLDLPLLEEINLDSCPVGDWAIAHLADNNVVPSLTSLDLADTKLSDSGMVHIAKFRNLTRLSLFYCNITDRGLRHVAELTELEVLNLDSRDISDSGLAHLRNCQKLANLDVFSGRITDSGCAHISRIKSLESLELCGGGVGDLGCSLLAGLENLTCLNLSQNKRITNRGASALALLKNLKALNLSNTRVDVASSLQLPKSLQSLALYGCRGIENDSVMSLLQTSLPSLQCLRLNSLQNDDGTMVGVEIDTIVVGDRGAHDFERLDQQPFPNREVYVSPHDLAITEGRVHSGRPDGTHRTSTLEGVDTFYHYD